MTEQAHPSIDTILYDLGGVLIDWSPRYLFARHFGDDTGAMDDFLGRVCTSEWNVTMDAGKPAHVARAERVAEHPEHETMIHRWFDEWPEMMRGEVPGALDILRDLRARGYRLFALTNWSADTFHHAQARFEFLNWFEHIVVSGEQKLIKPDPAIFRHAIERCNLDPARTLFIDDSEKNTQSAAALGLQVHHFVDARRLREHIAPLLARPVVKASR
ncbi:MAG: HAD family phosphatase [Betaproteobacteria bacterium]